MKVLLKSCDYRGAECSDVYVTWFSNPTTDQLTKISFTEEQACLLLKGETVEYGDYNYYLIETSEAHIIFPLES